MSVDTQGGRWSPALVLVLAVVLLAGALFGYDQGVISGALEGIKRDLRLSPLLIEVVTSWVTLGALAGSLAGGDLADRLGRRKALLAGPADEDRRVGIAYGTGLVEWVVEHVLAA